MSDQRDITVETGKDVVKKSVIENSEARKALKSAMARSKVCDKLFILFYRFLFLFCFSGTGLVHDLNFDCEFARRACCLARCLLPSSLMFRWVGYASMMYMSRRESDTKF